MPTSVLHPPPTGPLPTTGVYADAYTSRAPVQFWPEVHRCHVRGDIHGCLHTFLAAVASDGYDDRFTHPQGALNVLVGDVCDRGPFSPRMLVLCAALWDADRLVWARGNHEQALVLLLLGLTERSSRSTMETYAQLQDCAGRIDAGEDPVDVLGCIEPAEALSREWVTGISGADLLASLTRVLTELPFQAVLDRGRLVVAHAGVTPDRVGDDSRSTLQMNLNGINTDRRGRKREREALPARWQSVPPELAGVTVAYGHYHRAERTAHCVGLDRDCVRGEGLDSLSWPSGVVTTTPTATQDRQA